jgi:hypothetical protein
MKSFSTGCAFGMLLVAFGWIILDEVPPAPAPRSAEILNCQCEVRK